MIIEMLLEPLRYSFMVRAFIGTSLIAVIASVVGTFVVLKGLAFMGDAIAHTTFTGSALALLLGINLYVGGLFFAIFTALGVVFLTRVSKIKNDTALAVLFTGFFALGVIILATMPSFSGDLTSLLLGSVLAIRQQEIYLIIGVAIVIAVLLWVFFSRFVFVAFDPVGAEAAGLPVVALQSLLLGVVALAIVIAIQAVGVILVVALLITPAATGSLLTRRIGTLMLSASLIGLVSAISGLYLSYYLNAPPGATIVLVATTIFALTLGITKLVAWKGNLGTVPENADV